MKKIYKMYCMINREGNIVYVKASTIIEAKEICKELFGNSELLTIKTEFSKGLRNRIILERKDSPWS